MVVCAQVVMLVLAWKLDAQSMGYFTQQEWLRGMGSLQYVPWPLFLQPLIQDVVFSPFIPGCACYSVELIMKCLRQSFSAVTRCDSTERLRNSLDYLRSVLNDSTSFKLIYRYAFDFARVSLTQTLSNKICF